MRIRFLLSFVFIALTSGCGVQGPAISLGGSSSGGGTGVTTTTTYLYIWRSASTTDGNIGGRVGADAFCSADKTATYPALSCTNIRAFLTVSAADEVRDMPTLYSVPTTRAVRLPSGTPVATNFAALLSSDTTPLLNPISSTLNDQIWTGSWIQGNIRADHCNGWTSDANGDLGHGGFADNTNGAYIDVDPIAPFTCDNSLPIYCICF